MNSRKNKTQNFDSMSSAQQYHFNLEFFGAIEKNDLSLISQLHDQGADLDIKDSNGWTALMYASNKGLYEVALRLIEKGADLNAQNNTGSTALILACDECQMNLALMLIEKGACMEVKDNEGSNVLMLSYLYGCTDIVLTLIAYGANSMTLKQEDHFYGLTQAQAYAASGDIPKLRDLLNEPTPWRLACEQPQALIDIALKHGQSNAVNFIESRMRMKDTVNEAMDDIFKIYNQNFLLNKELSVAKKI